MIQERLIARVRELCAADGTLAAALMYGSFAQGTADAYSDIEFWLFFDERPGDVGAWLSRLGPLDHVVVNEFGAHVVFFPGLVRGEFHVGEISEVATWPARGGAVVVKDRAGELHRVLAALPDHPPLPDDPAELCGRFANWLVLALQVHRRGELLRTLDALEHARRHLIWMTRLAERRTQHWLTPSRAAETDLPESAVAALHATAGSPDTALAAAWRHGRRCWLRLGVPVPAALFAALDEALG